MPRRYNQRQKQPFKKRVIKAAKYAYKHRSTAAKAMALAVKVARMVNVEYKWTPIEIAAAVPNTGTIYAPLNDIVPGDGPLEREGDSLKLMRFSGRGFITQNASAQKTAVRIILFYGKQENQTAYTTGNILDTQNYPANTFLSPKSFSDKYRTKIIYDKTYHMSNNGNSSIVFDYNFKLFGHTKYNQGSTGPGSIENGGFYMLVISNESTNTPTLNFNGKVTFTDN